jgi:nitrogen regulatory protein P-II 1
MPEEARTVKLITAIVKPDRIDEVTHAATGAGARGMTVTEVQGFGQQYGHQTAADPLHAVLLVKLRLDVVVPDGVATEVVAAIAKAAGTGAIGDGKIWICPVEDALRIRTGEHGLDAL